MWGIRRKSIWNTKTIAGSLSVCLCKARSRYWLFEGGRSSNKHREWTTSEAKVKKDPSWFSGSREETPIKDVRSWSDSTVSISGPPHSCLSKRKTAVFVTALIIGHWMLKLRMIAFRYPLLMTVWTSSMERSFSLLLTSHADTIKLSWGKKTVAKPHSWQSLGYLNTQEWILVYATLLPLFRERCS